jgi:hypothetical protein
VVHGSKTSRNIMEEDDNADDDVDRDDGNEATK